MFLLIKKLARKFLLPISFFLFFFVAGAWTLPAQSFDSLQLEFTQEIVMQQTRQYFEGFVYFQKTPHLFVMHITTPINQYLFLKQDETLMYYPDQKKALRMTNAGKSANDAEIEIISLFEKDKGLSRKGFQLSGIEATGAGIESLWTPLVPASALVKEIRSTSNTDEEIFASKTYGLKGKLLSSTVFGNYRKILYLAYPALSITKNYSPEGKVLGRSTLSIKVTELNKPLPEAVTKFTIPADCAVEEMK